MWAFLLYPLHCHSRNAWGSPVPPFASHFRHTCCSGVLLNNDVPLPPLLPPVQGVV